MAHHQTPPLPTVTCQSYLDATQFESLVLSYESRRADTTSQEAPEATITHLPKRWTLPALGSPRDDSNTTSRTNKRKSDGFTESPVKRRRLADSDSISPLEHELGIEGASHRVSSVQASEGPIDLPDTSVQRWWNRMAQSAKLKILRHQWECASCRKLYSTSKAMEEHAASFKDSKDPTLCDKPFRCSKFPDCKSTYARYDSYYRHSKTHEADMAFSCDFCDRKGADGFDREDALKVHMKKYHKQQWTRIQAEYPKYCKERFCMHAIAKHGFKTEKKYLSHMSKVHGHGKLDCDFPGCSRTGKNGFTRRINLCHHRESEHSQQPNHA
jgi:hypothetical protein